MSMIEAMAEAARPDTRESTPRGCRTSDEVDDAAPMTNEGLGRAFRTALLLTASAERAEAAILEGIRVIDPFDVSDQSLLRETITASITAKIHGEQVEESEQGSSWLPLDLRRVLRLSRNLRHCFVLRVLVGLPREACALMLQTGTQQIDKLVCDSVQALAGLSQGEQLTRSRELLTAADSRSVPSCTR